MKPIKRTRTTLRQPYHSVLLGMALSAATSPVVAETRLNPFFDIDVTGASSQTGPMKPDVTEAASNVIAPESIPFESIPFKLVDHVAESVGGTSKSVPIPKRLQAHPPRRIVMPPATTTQRSAAIPVTEGDPNEIAGAPSLQSNQSRPTSTSASASASALGIPFGTTHQPLIDIHPTTAAQPWMQSITAESCYGRATRFLDDAYREYDVGAWSSAESSAWQAIELLATGVDIDGRYRPDSNAKARVAADEVRVAKLAMREARDFACSGVVVAIGSIDAIASSHQTTIHCDRPVETMTPSEAIDCYFDLARINLVPLATAQVQAAQAMDLLAAIHLGRDQAEWLPEETALCLRRAAFQGQPRNTSLASCLGMQLADMGIDREAEQTLRYAISLSQQPLSQQSLSTHRDLVTRLANVVQRLGRNAESQQLLEHAHETIAAGTPEVRTPTVVQLSPAQFAAISPALNASSQSSADGSTTTAQRPISRDVNEATSVMGDVAPKRSSRFTPALLAGFRMPLTGHHDAQPIDHQTQSKSDAPHPQPHLFKRVFGKLPTPW